ncbi:MAG: hypothetical protein ABGY72_12550, partial [bacterium]
MIRRTRRLPGQEATMSDWRPRILIGTILATLLGAATHAAQQTDPVEAHRALARTAAGEEHLALLQTVCRVPRSVQPRAASAPRPVRSVPAKEEWYAEPAQVFDNLYFVGTQDHGAWAVTTSEGIIIIDALYDYAVEAAVVDGLRKLGLDPEDITQVVISHG